MVSLIWPSRQCHNKILLISSIFHFLFSSIQKILSYLIKNQNNIDNKNDALIKFNKQFKFYFEELLQIFYQEDYALKVDIYKT